MNKYFIIKKYIFFIILLIIILAPSFTCLTNNTNQSSYISLGKEEVPKYKSNIPINLSWRNNIKRKPELKFTNNGEFKIVQFTDIQDGPDTDYRTLLLMNRILDYENPQLVILSGDNLDNRCRTSNSVKKAIHNLSVPMEIRQIPWAIVFGNHDEENGVLTKESMLRIYASYNYNLSQRGPKEIDGVGNYNLTVQSSKSEKTIFNIYLLDSGAYAPNNVGGYAWIKPSQIEWYRKTSTELKNKNGRKVPSLMFFHIPLPEFKQLWSSGKTIGNRNESVDSPKINSGLFSALLETGDVLGVFVGHDHTNDFVGDYYGITLGYSRNTGFGTYGKTGFSRGARVFLIKESDASHFSTWMRLASDFS